MGYGPMSDYQMPNNNGTSPNRKKLAIIFVAVAAVIVSSILFMLLGNRKDPTQDAMINLAIAQTELLRISTDQSMLLSSAEVKRHNAELNLTMQTNNRTVLAELKRVYGVKGINAKSQKAAQDKKADELLKSAKSLNRLDIQFQKTVSEKLAAQIELIQTAQSTIKSQQAKESLTTVAKNTVEIRSRFIDSATTAE